MIIVDSTVLISLSNIDRLDLIPENKLLIPEKVLKEITEEPTKKTLTGLDERVAIPKEDAKRRALKILGDEKETGDSNVLALFLDYPEYIVATDDKRLRNVCRALGARVTGTLGFIIYSVETGKLAKDEAIKLLRELDAMGFRMSIGLYEKAREIIEKAQ